MAAAGAGGRSSAQCRGMMYNRLSCVRCSSCFALADAEGDAAVQALHDASRGRQLSHGAAAARWARPPAPSLGTAAAMGSSLLRRLPATRAPRPPSSSTWRPPSEVTTSDRRGPSPWVLELLLKLDLVQRVGKAAHGAPCTHRSRPSEPPVRAPSAPATHGSRRSPPRQCGARSALGRSPS